MKFCFGTNGVHIEQRARNIDFAFYFSFYDLEWGGEGMKEAIMSLTKFVFSLVISASQTNS
jgi:hypothetical protein